MRFLTLIELFVNQFIISFKLQNFLISLGELDIPKRLFKQQGFYSDFWIFLRQLQLFVDWM